jgi:hypothetical protein
MSTKWNSQVLSKNGAANFGDLLKDEYSIILLQGKNVFGDLIYCYLKVAYPDVERLQLALQSNPSFTASDYGTVIAAGKGTPPDSVKSEIAATYRMFEEPRAMRPPPPLGAEKKAWDEY